MRIGVDLDGVAYDFLEAMSDWMVNRLGFHGCTVDNAAHSWAFYEGWGLTEKEFVKVFAAGVNKGFIFRHGMVLDAADVATWVLRRAGHSIHIVTDRSIGKPGVAAEATRNWLTRHDFQYDTLTFTADKTSVKTDMFVDDRLENYDALDAAGVEVYLVNRRWNQVPGDSRRRVSSIQEFVDIVLTRTSQKEALTV